MSEIANYMESVNAGAWADENIFKCGCKGSGWFLSELDTRHECPWHPGHPHPDEYEGYDGDVEVDDSVPLVEPETYELAWSEDDIPF